MPQRPRERVRLKDIADKAEISISAVSMALADHPEISPETKQRVRQLSRELGYRRRRRNASWKQGVPSRSSDRFGFLLIGSRLEDEAYSGMLRALTVGASAAGLRMEVQAIEDVADKSAVAQATLAYASGLDGLLLMGEVTKSLLTELEAGGVPHVVLGHIVVEPGHVPSGTAQVVASDEVGMGHLAVARLIEHGHRRIAFVSERMIRGLYNANWLTGYTAAHLEIGLSPDPKLIRVSSQVYADGTVYADPLLALPADSQPTAFVVPDTRVASTFIQAMRARNHEISRECIIIGGQQYVAARYGLEEYPLVLEELSRVAEIGLRHLRHVCEEPVSVATTVLVPFGYANLP